MTDREIFEEWLAETYWWASVELNLRGHYADDFVFFMWEAWLACRQIDSQERKEWFSDLPLDSLDLTTRTLNTLLNENIKTIGKLVSHSEVDLLRHTSLGKKALTEIKDVLRSRDLNLATISRGPANG